MKRIFLQAIIFFYVPVAALANDWYVDNLAKGLNNGRSWSDAWERMSDIDWGSISAGDTIFISGGNQQKIYYEKLIVGASGSAENPITITAAIESGHDGIVIINGENIRNCAVFENKENVELSFIQCDKSGEDSGSGSFHIDDSQSVNVENCVFTDINTHGAVYIQDSYDCVIGYNTITTNRNTFFQVDGIYGQNNDGNIYENNHIKILNDNDSPHCDAIQLYQENNYVIRGNIVNVANNSKINKQGIYCTDNYGVSFIYNNLVIYETEASGSLIAHYNTTAAYSGTVRIFNNTSVSLSGTGHCVRVIGDNNAVIKNNIFWQPNSKSTPATYGMPGNEINFATGNVDNNIYYCLDSKDIIYFNGFSLSLPQWQALGHGANSRRIDPGLNNDYKPRGLNAPGVDTGISLNGIFMQDISGTHRPQGIAWDIGAYEYSLNNGAGVSEGNGGGGGGCFLKTARFERTPSMIPVAVFFIIIVICLQTIFLCGIKKYARKDFKNAIYRFSGAAKKNQREIRKKYSRSA
jgi:hypothetical protein